MNTKQRAAELLLAIEGIPVQLPTNTPRNEIRRVQREAITAELLAALQAERSRIIEIVNQKMVSDTAADTWVDYSPGDINNRLDDIIEAINEVK